MKPLPHTEGHYIPAKLQLVIEGIGRPIGITVLVDGNIVIADSEANAVNIYSPQGGQMTEDRLVYRTLH